MIAQKQQHKREVENLTTDFKEQLEREQDKNAKEKAKMEKELKKMIKKAEKAELDLIKAESVKSSSAGSSNEALFQDMLGKSWILRAKFQTTEMILFQAISKIFWKINFSVLFVTKFSSFPLP